MEGTKLRTEVVIFQVPYFEVSSEEKRASAGGS